MAERSPNKEKILADLTNLQFETILTALEIFHGDSISPEYGFAYVTREGSSIAEAMIYASYLKEVSSDKLVEHTEYFVPTQHFIEAYEKNSHLDTLALFQNFTQEHAPIFEEGVVLLLGEEDSGSFDVCKVSVDRENEKIERKDARQVELNDKTAYDREKTGEYWRLFSKSYGLLYDTLQYIATQVLVSKDDILQPRSEAKETFKKYLVMSDLILNTLRTLTKELHDLGLDTFGGWVPQKYEDGSISINGDYVFLGSNTDAMVVNFHILPPPGEFLGWLFDHFRGLQRKKGFRVPILPIPDDEEAQANLLYEVLTSNARHWLKAKFFADGVEQMYYAHTPASLRHDRATIKQVALSDETTVRFNKLSRLSIVPAKQASLKYVGEDPVTFTNGKSPELLATLSYLLAMKLF